VRAKVAIAAMPTTSEIRAKRGGAAGHGVRIGGSGRVSGSGGRQRSNRPWAAAPLSIGPSSIENPGQSAAWSEDDGKPGVCKASTKKMGSGTSGAQLPTPCSASGSDCAGWRTPDVAPDVVFGLDGFDHVGCRTPDVVFGLDGCDRTEC